MKNFVDSIRSKEGLENWRTLYKKFKCREWKPAAKGKRGITCETKIESVEEIGRLIRDKSNPVKGAYFRD